MHYIMKYLLTIILAGAALFSSVSAQTEKGAYMLGGTTNLVGGFNGVLPNQLSLGFGKNKQKPVEVTYTNFNLSSNGGFFVANGLMLGLNVSAFHGNSTVTLKRDAPQRDTTLEENKLTDLALTPFVRYYLNQGQKVQYFGEARAGIGINKVNDNDSNSNAIVGAKAGAAIFLNSKVALDLFVDFTGGFSESKETGVSITEFDSVMGFGLGFDIFL